MNVGDVWSCSLAEGTLLGAAGLGCEQAVTQKLPSERLISGATWFSHCQRSKYHHSLTDSCSQSLQLDGAFDPNSMESLDPEAGTQDPSFPSHSVDAVCRWFMCWMLVTACVRTWTCWAWPAPGLVGQCQWSRV